MNRIPFSQGLDLPSIQLPPVQFFVTLSHAVSWIAFRHSIDGPQLSVELGIGKYRNPSDAADDARKDEAVADAVKQLTDFGAAGAIEILGRCFRDVGDDEIEIFTERIPALRLADYRWFDTLDDSLHRGLGLAWDHSRRQPFYPRDERHYRFVTVNRAELLRDFPPNSRPPAQSTGAAERQCEAWLLVRFSEDAERRKAKASFKADAIAKFRGNLTERGFNRAWAKVAEQAGRNKAGAKSKR